MREQDLVKFMKYIKENLEETKQIIKFLEEQDTAAGTDEQSDPDDKYSDEDTHNVMDNENEAGADEDTEDVMTEGEEEISGTEETSDGVDYPDVGDGTGVEGETLKEKCGKKHKKEEEEEISEETEEVNEESDEVTEEEEVSEEEEKVEECGTPSVGAATGAAIPNGTGSANDGVARVKSPLGKKPQSRYDEGFVANDGDAEDVLAMMESWKGRSKYNPNIGGF